MNLDQPYLQVTPRQTCTAEDDCFKRRKQRIMTLRPNQNDRLLDSGTERYDI